MDKILNYKWQGARCNLNMEQKLTAMVMDGVMMYCNENELYEWFWVFHIWL